MVIELHAKEGKTLKEIATTVHMSFRDISKIIKAHDNKIRLQKTKKENNEKTTTTKLSKSSQAYILFRNRKTPVEVAIELDLEFQKVRKYWTEFLRLQKMDELYHLYVDNEYHMNYLFKIYYFLLRNQIDFKDIENVLQTAYDITKLYQTHSNLKAENEKLEQEIKKNSFRILPPLRPLPRYP